MFCLDPVLYLDYSVGDVGFTARPDSSLHENIAFETDRASQEAGRLVPTHALLITGPNEIVEATWPRVRKAELAPLIADPKLLLWVRRPQGQTREAVQKTVRLAREIADSGAPYDWRAFWGFLTSDQDGADGQPNPYQRDEAWFCSELIFHLLKATRKLRTERWPADVLGWPKGYVSPDRLHDFPVWEGNRLSAVGAMG